MITLNEGGMDLAPLTRQVTDLASRQLGRRGAWRERVNAADTDYEAVLCVVQALGEHGEQVACSLVLAKWPRPPEMVTFVSGTLDGYSRKVPISPRRTPNKIGLR